MRRRGRGRQNYAALQHGGGGFLLPPLLPTLMSAVSCRRRHHRPLRKYVGLWHGGQDSLGTSLGAGDTRKMKRRKEKRVEVPLLSLLSSVPPAVGLNLPPARPPLLSFLLSREKIKPLPWVPKVRDALSLTLPSPFPPSPFSSFLSAPSSSLLLPPLLILNTVRRGIRSSSLLPLASFSLSLSSSILYSSPPIHHHSPKTTKQPSQV